jgi:hypothetical protein
LAVTILISSINPLLIAIMHLHRAIRRVTLVVENNSLVSGAIIFRGAGPDRR